MKKIIISVVIIVCLAAIGFAVFIFMKKNPEIIPSPATPSSTLPAGAAVNPVVSSNGTLKILSDEPVFDYWIASGTQEIIYLSQKGKIIKANPDKDAILSEQTAENVSFIKISPDNQKILFALNNANQQQFSIYDLIKNTWRPLPLEVESAAWSPEGKRLIAIVKQNGRRDLALLNLEGKISKTIFKNFGLIDQKIEWLRLEEIDFIDKPSGLINSAVWRLNLSNLGFNEIIPAGKGLLIKWLSKNFGLKFQEQKSSLIDWNGKTLIDSPLLLLPDKCALKAASLYCFIFSLNQNKILWPDDYLQKLIYTNDALYKFDLNNLAVAQPIFDNWGGSVDAFNLKFTNGQLLFINRYDDLLYSLKINK